MHTDSFDSGLQLPPETGRFSGSALYASWGACSGFVKQGPSSIFQLNLCCVCCRLEGSQAAQKFAMQLIQLALKRSQFYLCAEILRFLIPPREGVLQWGPSSPVLPVGAAGSLTREPSGGSAQPAAPQKQPSGSAAAAAASSGQSGWFSWIWGGGAAGQQQQSAKSAQQAGSAAGDQDAIAAGYSADGLVGQGLLSLTAGVQHGSDACRIVADKAWRLLHQVSNGQRG